MTPPPEHDGNPAVHSAVKMEPEMEVTRLGRFLEGLVNRSRLLSKIMLVIMAALVVADIAIPTGYDRFFWERLGGAGALYGLFACFVIVVVSKFLGYKLLYRPEDYFDNERQGNKLIGDPQAREAGHD
ncbi:MAG: hypothetical protein Q8M53_01965 [Burkholderiales bacterium]|nr:hypothetical protein [Burkholderiales bacterium]